MRLRVTTTGVARSGRTRLSDFGVIDFPPFIKLVGVKVYSMLPIPSIISRAICRKEGQIPSIFWVLVTYSISDRPFSVCISTRQGKKLTCWAGMGLNGLGLVLMAPKLF